MNFLAELNAEQQKAVYTTEGPVIINAGPGTGKTKTLTYRIAYLILEKKVKPENIIALTFTQKAAAEMKNRVNIYLKGHMPYIHTFHSFCHSIQQDCGRNYSIISDKEREDVLHILKKRYDRDEFIHKLSIKDLSLLISRYKNDSLLEQFNDCLEEFIHNYNETLTKNNFIDYDDLLLHTYNLLKNNNELKNNLVSKYSYIHVDEFQDTNAIQYLIIKSILNKQNNIFVIGDPKQSIYSFRGARPEIMEQIKIDFPRHTNITLHINYRSSTEINRITSTLFPNEQPLIPATSYAGKAVLIKTLNEYSEADLIIRMICEKVGGIDLLQSGDLGTASGNEASFADFAVLYRTHYSKRTLELKLNKANIPYQIIGEDSPFKEKEIMFIILCLRYAFYKEKIFLEQLLSSRILKSLQQKVELEKYLESVSDEKLDNIYKNIILISKVKEGNSRLEKNKAVNFFDSIIFQFNKYNNSLERCIKYLEYLEDNEYYDMASDKVVLMTMHASKGLEFPYVYIAQFEEGNIPHNRKDSNIEEEKRLLYVAMARAKRELYITYTKTRQKRSVSISRFYSYLNTHIEQNEDEDMKKIIKRIQKKNQLSLF